MKFILNVNDENIRKAAMLVMKHYQDEYFLNMVSTYKYNHTIKTGKEVANDILNCNLEIKIEHYKSINPFTRAIAYAKDDTIYFNQRKFFPVIDRVETIVHESLHLMGFTHRGNFVSKYNLQTVPYKVANIFSKHIREIYGNNP